MCLLFYFQYIFTILKLKKGGISLIIQSLVKRELSEPIISITASTLKQAKQLHQDISAAIENKQVLVIKTKNGLESVFFGDIVFIEIFKEDITIHLNNQTLLTKGRLYKIMEKLPESTFIQIHKSIVLNIDNVTKLEYSFSGTMTAWLNTGEKLPVSRRYATNLKTKLKQLGGD